MNTETLVELVKQNLQRFCYELSSERKIFDAVIKVDRKMFLDENDIIRAVLSYVEDVNDLGALHNKLGTKEFTEEALKSYFMAIEKILSSSHQVYVESRGLAYNDMAINIGKSGQTCSQPSVTCIMMDMLQLEKGMNVLEIGSGCGYSAAICAEIIGEKGKLTTVEVRPELARIAEHNLRKYFRDKYERRIEVITANGKKGYAPNSQYDRIYLTASVVLKKFRKDSLVKQLKPKGILLYPEKVGALFAEKYENGNCIDKKAHEGVLFVPLVD